MINKVAHCCEPKQQTEGDSYYVIETHDMIVTGFVKFCNSLEHLYSCLPKPIIVMLATSYTFDFHLPMCQREFGPGTE